MRHSTVGDSDHDVLSPLDILVVDDEEWMRGLIEKLLSLRGHRVTACIGGREALEIFRSRRIDLVVTDRVMPGLTGDDVAAAIKTTSPRTPVLMLTGYGDIMEAQGEHPAGVDYILCKPFTPTQLDEALRRVLRDALFGISGNLHLIKALSPHPPEGVDVKLIGQAARHLVRNAIEPTPSGGRIEIRIETTASGLRLYVADNGPGVPPEFQSQSFEKSGAVQDAKARRRSVGLGLVFCRLAVGLHGGSVGVESRGDEGSTFWFELTAVPMASGAG